MEWITAFQRRFDLLQRDLDPFISNYIRLYKHNYRQYDRLDVEIIIDNLTTLSRWVHALPADEAVWRYVDLPRALEPGLRQLQSLQGTFDIALSHRRIEAGSTLHIEIGRMRGQIAQVRAMLQKCPLPNLAPTATDAPVAVFPFIILHGIWLEIFYRCTIVPLKGPDIRDWPPVVYHPYSTNRLARRAAESLWGHGHLESIKFSAKQTPAFFELALTRGNLHMRPEFWDTMLPRLPQDHLEYLRAMGGEIAPLTWDEGAGEGVVLRLPWAESQ